MLSFQITIIIIIIVFLIILLSLINTYLKENKHNKTILKPIIKYFNKPSNKDLIKEYDYNQLYNDLMAPKKRGSLIEMGINPFAHDGKSKMPFYYNEQFKDSYHLYGNLERIEDIKEKKELNYNDLYNTNYKQQQKEENKDNNKIYNPLIDNNMIIPLMGRNKYFNDNSQFEYYSKISMGNNNIKIPINETKRVFNNDKIEIPELKGIYKVHLYPTEELQYNPYIF